MQCIYYFDDEQGRRCIAIMSDGRGEMFRIDLGCGDGLVGIDIRMFESSLLPELNSDSNMRVSGDRQ